MPVAGVGIDDIVNRGIRYDEAREKPGPAALLTQRENQSPETEHRRRQEQRTAKVPEGSAVSRLGHTVPVIENALQADQQEPSGMSADPIERQSLAVSRVGKLSHALEFIEFQLVQIRLQIDSGHSVGAVSVPEAKLKSEIVPQKYEAAEDLIIPRQPRRQYQKKYGGRDGNAGQRWQGSTVSLAPYPQAAEWQEGQHRGIRQGPHAAEQAEEYPVAPLARLFQLQREKQDERQDQGGQRGVPNPVNRPVPNVWKEGPRPCRPQCDVLAESSAGYQINRNAGQCRQQAVDGQQRPGGGVSVNPKHLEDCGHQIGVQWRFPGGGAGAVPVGTAVAVSLGDGAGDAAHLPSKTEVIVWSAGAVLAEDSDGRHLKRKRQQHEPQHRLGAGGGPGSLHRREVYQLRVSAMAASPKGARGMAKSPSQTYADRSVTSGGTICWPS